ncbi:tRNA (guanosine(37)-N1)-methyltransferase TrmD [Chlorobium sp. BLA1]|uniref:tRNA (guanosine(37)-N1)-methyltransferase TrmD n=1 Tax=Candidatus Chlorobium masyuteum TaxID=2716876 RepID=UPI001424480E|nr:tRNA (guanosine(37)-N1)-methyltransferase TrmD [Candidatus Chlorobium masyuteum]NHQ60475.1 tRNA (guanosine(37)-N1)-methyltransferase TrmD [Candidatus Chlorobium masyuteum]NTU43946.1 tRNA (guanosine(37)-N1)-methyltransferase TrmD [Chlorobiaceae bacterium]
MRIDVISVIPGFFDSVLDNGLLSIARKKQYADIHIHNLHDYGLGRYRQVDDSPFGGGAGMVLRPEPVFSCIEALQAERVYDEVIFLTPDGKLFEQSLANRLSGMQNLIILCGHYKAVDERIRQKLITMEISIGDVVLSGGEIPALLLMDAVLRVIPGVLGDSESALTDSFQNGLLDCVYYTRPAEFRGMKVPDILMSGHHSKIEQWRGENALERTRTRRPDLLGHE